MSEDQQSGMTVPAPDLLRVKVAHVLLQAGLAALVGLAGLAIEHLDVVIKAKLSKSK